jgi:hypothetical protein
MKAFSLAVLLVIMAASVTFAGCIKPVTKSENGHETAIVATPVMAETDGARLTNLTRFVEKAAAYAKEQGKAAALKEFNDLNGTFTEGNL